MEAVLDASYFNPKATFFLVANYRVSKFDRMLEKYEGKLPTLLIHLLMLATGDYLTFYVLNPLLAQPKKSSNGVLGSSTLPDLVKGAKSISGFLVGADIWL
jgi:hypothetical protein